jgi:iron complex outermembrane receptor protein
LYAKFDFSPTLNLHLDYTYLDRKNKSNPGIRLIDAPKHKAFAYLVYNPVEALELIASVNYEGSRLNETDGSRGVGSFTVANLKASWNLSARLRAEFGVNNVLDENYAYDEGYPEPGRNFILNLRYRY